MPSADAALLQIRGTLEAGRANARSVAALTENPGCTRRRVIDAAGVKAYELAERKMAGGMSFGGGSGTKPPNPYKVEWLTGGSSGGIGGFGLGINVARYSGPPKPPLEGPPIRRPGEHARWADRAFQPRTIPLIDPLAARVKRGPVPRA